MKISPPDLIFAAHATLGEGPVWDATRRVLYWVDIHAGHLHVHDGEAHADEVMAVDAPLGCVAPTRSGNLIAGVGPGIAILRLKARGGAAGPATAEPTYLARLEAHLPGNRVNDGKCGPDGRFLVGTMDDAEKEASGSLYSYAPDGTLKTLLGGVGISNGLAWSPDLRKLYYIDTPTRDIVAYDYDLGSGEIADPRVVVRVPPSLGWPDGMTSDAAGRLWVAMWGGAALTVWDPRRGELVERIPLPARNVTACAFGGADGTDLYVTSARKGLGPGDLTEFPASGGLFRLRTDVAGMPTFSFAD